MASFGNVIVKTATAAAAFTASNWFPISGSTSTATANVTLVGGTTLLINGAPYIGAIDTGVTTIMRSTKLAAGGDYGMPDGSMLHIDGAGNYRIDDKDAQVTYQANRIREFNRFLNASDLLADFIADLGRYGAKQGDVLEVPLGLFVNWLVLKAAEQDGEPAPVDIPRIESHPAVKPRCRGCGRFIPQRHLSAGLRFCSGAHADAYLEASKA